MIVIPFQKPEDLKSDAKFLADNDKAVKKAQAKIDSLTTSSSKSFDPRAETCKVVITNTIKLTRYISEAPSSRKVKV